MASIWEELKRRNVVRVAMAYVVVAWLLLQVSDVVLGNIEAPTWVFQAILLLLVIGFPLALILAWAFELTSEGVKKEKDVDRSESLTHVTGRKLDFAIIGLMAVAILYLVVDNYVLSGPDPQEGLVDVSQPVPGFSNRAAIAVLPFVNISNDPDQEYFADGITEDLITGLQSFRTFPIISRTSTFRYKGTSPDIREVAADLDAGYVIEGSVRKVGNDVRINVQLNNDQGQQLWAVIYNFKFQDVLRIQSELVGRIMVEIEPELLITESDRTRFMQTEDMEAYDYFLRAANNTMVAWAFTNFNGEEITPERLEIAREYALKAVELDPGFAAAWRILNHIDGQYVISFSHLLSAEERQQHLDQSIEYGKRSRALSPFEPSVCSCLAAMLMINGELDDARQLQEESLQQNPYNAAVHAVMAKILQVSGEFDRAMEEVEIALRLSPRGIDRTYFLYFQAAILQELGHFEEAVATARQSLLLVPQNDDAEYVKIVSLLALGQRQPAYEAMVQFRENHLPGFQPGSGFDQGFFESAANAIELSSGASLHGLSYNQGLRLIFEDLGWNHE